eukprot:312845-Chlamydomonas_euryale.AAC.5
MSTTSAGKASMPNPRCAATRAVTRHTPAGASVRAAERAPSSGAAAWALSRYRTWQQPCAGVRHSSITSTDHERVKLQ